VAEPPPRQARTVLLEYRFDRLLPDKLVQAYELLASDRCWSIAPSSPTASCQEVVNEQTGRPLRPGVLRPAREEQREIVNRVRSLFTLSDAIEERLSAANGRIEKLTQSILAKAFRGELVPTEAELARREGRDYEHAAVLLERIKNEREKETKPNKRRRKLVATR
jgi:predicted amidophosphoribosyltransferase